MLTLSFVDDVDGERVDVEVREDEEEGDGDGDGDFDGRAGQARLRYEARKKRPNPKSSSLDPMPHTSTAVSAHAFALLRFCIPKQTKAPPQLGTITILPTTRRTRRKRGQRCNNMVPNAPKFQFPPPP